MKLLQLQEVSYDAKTSDSNLPEWFGASSDFDKTDEYRAFVRQHADEYDYFLNELKNDAVNFEIHDEDDIYNWSDSVEADAGPRYGDFTNKIYSKGGADHLDHAEADVHEYVMQQLHDELDK